MAQEYGSRVWAGDPATVAEARERYLSDPQGQLVPFAVALYSFRNTKRFSDELLGIRKQLITYTDRFMRILPVEDASQEAADRSDVLSTHLEWMSRQTSLSAKERRESHAWATQVCDYGIWLALRGQRDSAGNHTWCLLTLTDARLHINSQKYCAALHVLHNVGQAAVRINDANQRARVYRKLGFLYRKCDRALSGLSWGIRACFVPGVPMAVRAKSVAALLGIDR